jgi:hypothetical protein
MYLCHENTITPLKNGQSGASENPRVFYAKLPVTALGKRATQRLATSSPPKTKPGPQPGASGTLCLLPAISKIIVDQFGIVVIFFSMLYFIA